MSRELRPGMPQVLHPPRRITSRRRIVGHVECRRFCEPSGGERLCADRKEGLLHLAPLSACQFALLVCLVYVALFTRDVSCLICNCNGTETCDASTGFCKNGCAPGWFGSGCQVGNMAYMRNAKQSTLSWSNHASRAVDGSTKNYSQTQSELTPWWYVTLSPDKDIVITNVTFMTNTDSKIRPKHWLILYTRDSSDSNPDPKKWTMFAYKENVTDRPSFGPPTDELVVGRRVAIYINGTSNATTLKLFEVYVFGFYLSVKPSPFNATWKVDSTCDAISVTATYVNIASLWPLSVLLFGNTTDGNTVSKKIILSTNRTQFTLAVSTKSNRSYVLSIISEICLSDMVGEELAASLSSRRICLKDTTILMTNVQTPSRTYEAWTNGSCLLISVRSPPEESCNSPILLTARCGTNTSSANFTDDGIAKLCGLIDAMTCKVNVTLSNNITEFDVVSKISREPSAYVGNWSAHAACDYIDVRLSGLPLGSAVSLVSVFVNDSGKIHNMQQFLRNNESHIVKFHISVDANRSYVVWISRLLCATNCLGEYIYDKCSYSSEKNCITVSKSNVTEVTTRSRVYEAWANNSCVLVGARSPSEVHCDSPVLLLIACANASKVGLFSNDGVAILCGFKNTTSCSANVALRLNVTEVSIENIPSPPIANITGWNAESTCDFIRVNISAFTKSTLITSFMVYVNDNGKIHTQLLINNGTPTVSTAVPVSNGSYNLWVSGQRCLTKCVGQLNDTNCPLLHENYCLTTATSVTKTVTTKSRVYEALSNKSCVVMRLKTEPSCEHADLAMLQCGKSNSSVKITQTSTTFCGFPNNTGNNCSVFIVTADGRIKSDAVAYSEVVTNLSGTLWNTTSTCDIINISLTKIHSQMPIYAMIRTGESDVFDSSLTNYTDISNHGITVSVPADPNLILQIIVAQCVENLTCNAKNHQQCISRDSCFIEHSSKKVRTILTEYREYETWTNASCVFTKISSNSSPHCQFPKHLSIICNNASIGVANYDSSVASLCNLLPGTSYDCIVSAVISDEHTERRSEKVSTELIPTPTTAAGEIAGAAIGSCLLAALLACFAFVLRRYRIGQNRNNGNLHSICNGLNTKCNCFGTTKSKNGGEVEEIAVDDGTESANIQGMSLPEFFEYAQKDELICLKYEKHVPRSSILCEVGRDEINKSKNKFQNIVPYDANRVILNRKNDYINASFINGYFKERKYIATQGPTLNTIEDFWHMVWQQKVSTIVMLTDFFENSKKKCEAYFPASCSRESLVQVNVRSQNTFDCYAVTVLDIEMSSESRTVTHYHMLAWKDHSIPDHCAQLVLFYSLIEDLTQQSSAINQPTVVVHCSAGAGRTGTFIAFDWLQHCAKIEKRVDVDQCVKTLRAQRMQMVQTKDQYLFLHKAVFYGIKTLQFTFKADFLSSLVSKIPPQATSTSMLDEEWHVLDECRNSVRHCYEAANKPENRCKNRSLDVLASDSKRVFLQVDANSPSDYINAVYCNGCYSDKGFVVSQIPLESTVNDFWRMVYDIQASCIVLVHDFPTEEDCAHYYPNCGQSMTVGGFLISNDSPAEEKRYSDYETLNLLISRTAMSSNNEVSELNVKLIVLTTWKHDEATPKSTGSVLEVLTELRPYCQDSSRRPIIVQCRDGASHSGLFVCAANAFHRLIETNQVQVFHSVDLARSSRPEFLVSMDQYRFIYFLLLQHYESSAVYANA